MEGTRGILIQRCGQYFILSGMDENSTISEIQNSTSYWFDSEHQQYAKDNIDKVINVELVRVIVARGSMYKISGIEQLYKAEYDTKTGRHFFYKAIPMNTPTSKVQQDCEAVEWETALEEASKYAKREAARDEAENNVPDTFWEHYKYFLESTFILKRKQ